MEITDCVSNMHDQPSIKQEKSESHHLHTNGDFNGIPNGHIEKERSHHKSENRDKDRHREKDKHRDKEKSRDKDKHSSSGSKDKEKHSSSSKDKERSDKHRDKDREREKDKERSKDKEHKERSDKDKEKSRSDKERSEKDKERSKDKEKHRDEKSKHESKSSSSSSSKDKSKSSSGSKEHSSSKDKDRESREKERSKDKEKERSKDKHRDSSSPDKKHKDGEHRSKEHKSSSKDKERSKSHSKEVKIKEEKIEPVSIKKEVESQQEEEDNFEMRHPVKEEPMEVTESPPKVKKERKASESDDDDKPLMERSSVQKRKAPASAADDSEEDVPLMQRKKVKKEKVSKKRSKQKDSEDEEEDFKPVKAPKKKKSTSSQNDSVTESPKKGGRKKKEEEQVEVWKWWEEQKPSDGTKWTYLEHKGPVFAPDYEPLPEGVKFKYDGKTMKLSLPTEEVAGFYGRMLDHDFTTKDTFNNNFFKDWRKVMTPQEKEKITDLSKCDFKQIDAYYKQKSEERKAMSKEEKEKIKVANAELVKTYGIAVIDGHKEKIGNFKIEPPGLFRGRGEHPKMGKLKKRVMPEDVIINCSKDAPVPKPPAGHKWKEVRHDNSVTWLASWTENVQGQVKYVMLNPSSKLKGEKDMQKYETARKLHKRIDKIREEYRQDWKHKEMRIRQRSVALYFIDKLALRAGNEKDEDQADTVGCCSLRVEHISLHEEKDDKQNVVVFDFLGKDSIRYYNEVPVEKRVFKNLQLFLQGKNKGDDLFDRLNTAILNKHLNDLMEGLTAKVFRTYNASITLQQQLDELTDPDANLPEMLLAYNRANRAVAILCNHQRSVPKTHAKSMENLKNKIDAKKEAIEEAKAAYSSAKKEYKHSRSERDKILAEKKKKMLDRQQQMLAKLELQATDREENKEIALGTSKLNYLDPRISVAWCKKYNVPIDKIYNKTQREKFHWAIDMAGPDYVF